MNAETKSAQILTTKIFSVLGRKTIILSDSKFPGKQKIVFVLPSKYKIKGQMKHWEILVVGILGFSRFPLS